jgi:hypothetical protein
MQPNEQVSTHFWSIRVNPLGQLVHVWGLADSQVMQL